MNEKIYLTEKEIVELENKIFALTSQYSKEEIFGQRILDFEKEYWNEHQYSDYDSEHNNAIFIGDVAQFFFNLDIEAYSGAKYSFSNHIGNFIQIFLDAASKRCDAAGNKFMSGITDKKVIKEMRRLDVEFAQRRLGNAKIIYNDWTD